MFTKRLILITLAAIATAIGSEAQLRAVTAGDMPEQWAYTSEFVQQDPVYDSWWQLFGDAQLDSLIARGIANNFDLKAAASRIKIAQQQLRMARAGYFPQIGLSGGWTKQQSSGKINETPQVTTDYFDLGLSMNWEIDVFGKIYSQSKAKKAAVEVSRATRTAAEVSIAANIASAYMQLRTLQAREALMLANTETQKEVLRITQVRYETGLSSKLDVMQATTTYASTKAAIADVHAAMQNTIYAMAVLLAEYPASLEAELGPFRPMPEYQKIVAVGVPAQLLRRRPDVIEAEAMLAQYAAELGVAKKDFLPTISIQGSIGTSAHKGGDLFTDKSFTYSIAPRLSWTLFDGLSRHAGVVAAREQMQIGIDNYNNTVLGAIQEVNTAMSSYTGAIRYIQALDEALSAANESFTLSMDLYKQGLTSFINVQNAQASVLQYSDQVIEARGRALSSLIQIYRALGGGF